MYSGLVLALLAVVVCVDAHGRFWEPAGRGTEWRRGYPVPEPKRDYNDIELYCGGRGIHYEQNNGNCGVCGDDWAEPEPREHEDFGLYDNGYITGIYTAGTLIEVQVELTKNHLGWIEFHLCARDDKATEPLTHACLEQHVLENHKGETRFNIGDSQGFLTFKLQLPKGLSCKACVLRWKYNTGNDWGICPNGTGMVGCNDKPEQFYACADIEIK